MAQPDLDAALDDDIGDDLLRLVFIACHPVLSHRGARRAHAAPARRPDAPRRSRGRSSSPSRPSPSGSSAPSGRLSETNVPFEVPRGAELAARLSSVLAVIYLIFNEGYSATAGDDWMRPQLCEEALRLGRILAELAPRGAGGAWPRRAHGDPGVALRGAHRPSGEPVLLLDQDRARWDQLLIRRGLAALDRATA